MQEKESKEVDKQARSAIKQSLIVNITNLNIPIFPTGRKPLKSALKTPWEAKELRNRQISKLAMFCIFVLLFKQI